ncbi:DUF1702 family protein [Myxococcota bacterium]|nr:DUF1702 family protein [Myxococcota bacterium]
MIFSFGVLRRFVFGLSNRHGCSEVRGFHQESPARRRLELVARTVIEHYNTALEEGAGEGLETRLGFVDPELHGFACEGAAMGLFILDRVVPGRRGHFSRFLAGHGQNHRYMSYIGAGLGVGAFRLSHRDVLAEEAHFSRVLVLDGLGFHHGYFRTEPTVRQNEIPADILGDPVLRERFDSGLGRALWFVENGVPERLAATVAAFPVERRPELWAGIGLAATYAGGVPAEWLHALVRSAGAHRVMLAQGSLLACHARHRAGNPAPHNDLAATILAGIDAGSLHRMAEEHLAKIDERSEMTSGRTTWSVWIEGVRGALAAHLGSADTRKVVPFDSRLSA